MITTADRPTIVRQTFYISTGRKNAMHTLRYRRDVEGSTHLSAYMPDNYLRNLAVDVETAQTKAQEFFDAWQERVGGSRADFILSLELEPEYDITKRRGKLSAADTIAIEKIEAGVVPFGKHSGTLIADLPDQYILWAADNMAKPETAERPAFFALCAACLGIASEKGLIAKRDIARAERVEADAKSEFIGNVGVRCEFSGEVVTAFFKNYPDQPEAGFWINKVRVNGNLVVYIGSKKLGEVGSIVTFKATIKDHSTYQGVKSTKVNRPVLV